MLIDWFTVGAQAINFLILVWLLKRFLYKPILNAIDAREKRIAGELVDADAKRKEAQNERDDFQAKNKVLDDQRSALLSEVTDEAKVQRNCLLDEARKEADGLRGKQRSALRDDRARLGNEITRLAQEEVFEIARKTLADLATVSLEKQMVDVFIRRLREMSGKEKDALGTALKTSSVPALVRSMLELPAEQKASIQNALNESVSAAVSIRFETARETICGIELSANGQKIAWSIKDYLASLEQKVGALVEAQTVAAPPSGNPPGVK